MKLASFIHGGTPSYGLVEDNGIIDLKGYFKNAPTLKSALAQGILNTLDLAALSAEPRYRLDEVTLQQPIVDPGKILCVGVNYRNRHAEMAQTNEPRYPSLFMRPPSAQAPHGQAILKPLESDQLYYEGEIAIIIGRRGRRIPEHEALDHIAGFSCFNEGSLKDYMQHGVYNVTAGKIFDNSGGFGPWMTTLGAVDPHNMRIRTRVNGRTVQDDTTANMIASFSRLIAYISSITTLEPGDVIASGTPTGAGAKLDPPLWLKDGDVIEVEVDGVGILRNPVHAE